MAIDDGRTDRNPTGQAPEIRNTYFRIQKVVAVVAPLLDKEGLGEVLHSID